MDKIMTHPLSKIIYSLNYCYGSILFGMECIQGTFLSKEKGQVLKTFM